MKQCLIIASIAMAIFRGFAAAQEISNPMSVDSHEEHGHDESGHDESGHDESGHDESGHDESGHDESGHDEHGHSDEPGTVELSKAAMDAAGIEVTNLTFQSLSSKITAPGEIILDQYASADVVPIIDAVVIKRYAQLGDEVEAGQDLVTLASVEVAEAQGVYRLAATEWNRVRQLGRSSVGAQRYTQSQVSFEQAGLTLRTYGLDDQQIQTLAESDLTGTLGQFNLVSPIAGTVLQDAFRLGERIEAGRQLFLITDESRVWVQANLSPTQAKGIEVGASARVNMGEHWHDGEVIQRHHMLDEQTRTISVRIAIEIGEEHHHAGEFVQVEIALNSNVDNSPSSTFIVTESALMQDDEGNWTVFVQLENGHFRQTPIVRGASQGGQIAISGLAEGTPVVTSGAFFLAAELAKSGFDIHNH